MLKRQMTETGMTLREIEDYIGFICANAERYEVSIGIWPILADPDDEFIARLALVSGCHYIVTHNVRHFKSIGEKQIAVVTPREFLAIIRGKS